MAKRLMILFICAFSPVLFLGFIVNMRVAGEPSEVIAKAEGAGKDSTSAENWEAFGLANLVDQREQSGRPYLRFLDRDTLSAGLYVLPAGGVDNQTPHALDEVYYFIEGKAMLSVDGADIPVKSGSVVFVKRDVEHRLHSIEEEVKVLVFFSTAMRN